MPNPGATRSKGAGRWPAQKLETEISPDLPDRDAVASPRPLAERASKGDVILAMFLFCQAPF